MRFVAYPALHRGRSTVSIPVRHGSSAVRSTIVSGTEAVQQFLRSIHSSSMIWSAGPTSVGVGNGGITPTNPSGIGAASTRCLLVASLVHHGPIFDPTWLHAPRLLRQWSPVRVGDMGANPALDVARSRGRSSEGSGTCSTKCWATTSLGRGRAPGRRCDGRGDRRGPALPRGSPRRDGAGARSLLVPRQQRPDTGSGGVGLAPGPPVDTREADAPRPDTGDVRGVRWVHDPGWWYHGPAVRAPTRDGAPRRPATGATCLGWTTCAWPSRPGRGLRNPGAAYGMPTGHDRAHHPTTLGQG